MPEDAHPARGVIRIMLEGVPGLMADLVRREVLAQSDMTIVRPRGMDGPGEAGAQDGFDVLVTSLSGPRVPDRYQRLLFEHPHVTLVAISQDGRRVEVFDRQVVREITLEHLVDVIREVARARDVPSGL